MIQDTSVARCSGSVPSAPQSPSQHLSVAVVHAPPFLFIFSRSNPFVCPAVRSAICPTCLSGCAAWKRKLLFCSGAQARATVRLLLNELGCWELVAAGSGLPECPVPQGPHRCAQALYETIACALTVSSFSSAGPSDPHAEATPQEPPDIRG